MAKRRITPFPLWQSLKPDGHEQRYIRMGNSQLLHPAIQNLNPLPFKIYTFMLLESGGKLWEFSAKQGDVLYLALEDNFNRLQNRLKQMAGRDAKSASLLAQAARESEKEDISRLHLATASFGLQDGLLEQIHNFLAVHSDTNLIAIDTLEHIRNGEQNSNLYACDYQDMNRLREITDKHNVTLMLIHHTRKMYDPDPLNTISGSTGLIGAVDGVLVLEKSKRTGSEAKLTIANRDTEGFCFTLLFDKENAVGILSATALTVTAMRTRFAFCLTIFCRMIGAARQRNCALNSPNLAAILTSTPPR